MAIAVLTFLSAIVIGASAVLTSAITLAATALIVPGTGTHDITTVKGYKENAADRYIAPATSGSTAYCTSTNGCALIGIPYPASFFPIPLPGWCPNLNCDTWNQSVGAGVAALNSELINQLTNPTPNNKQIILFGYSQGGAVVSAEMYNLAKLDPATKSRIQVVTIGNIDNPQGLWTRLSFLPTIPFLNITFGPVLPTNIGIKSTNYSFEYDPVGDAPLYILNPLAILNALAAFWYVHGNYLVPNSNDPGGTLPYGYTPATLAAAIADPANRRTYQDATFVLIPEQGTLPILQPFLDIGAALHLTPLVKPFVDLLNPIFKVLINLAYDRTLNPGIPETFQLFPIVNPITLITNLITAGLQGIQAALKDIGLGALGGLLPAAPLAPKGPSTVSPSAPVAPTITSPVEMLAPRAPNGSSVAVSTLTSVKPKSTVGTLAPATNPGGKTASILPFTVPVLPKPTSSAATGTTQPNVLTPVQVIQRANATINELTKPTTAGKPSSGSKTAA